MRRAPVGQRPTIRLGPGGASAYGNAINSDGYRQNNQLQQQNGVGELRFTGAEGGAYLNLSATTSISAFPAAAGDAHVQPGRQRPARRRDPFDYGDKQGLNGTIGVTRMLARHRSSSSTAESGEEAAGRLLRRQFHRRRS